MTNDEIRGYIKTEVDHIVDHPTLLTIYSTIARSKGFSWIQIRKHLFTDQARQGKLFSTPPATCFFRHRKPKKSRP